MLRSLGFGLGLETFANFWRVSVLVLENLVSGKKSRFWFRSKFWYRHSVLCKLCLQPHIYHPCISIIMQIWDNHERAGSWHFYVSKTVTQIIQNIYLRTKRILLRIKKTKAGSPSGNYLLDVSPVM